MFGGAQGDAEIVGDYLVGPAMTTAGEDFELARAEQRNAALGRTLGLALSRDGG